MRGTCFVRTGLLPEVPRHVVEPRELDHGVPKPARRRLVVEELGDVELEGEDQQEEEGPEAKGAAAEEPEGRQPSAVTFVITLSLPFLKARILNKG